MVQITLQLFALSLPRVAVPQFEGVFKTQDRSSVRAMSSQIASMTSLPSTAPLLGEVVGLLGFSLGWTFAST